MITKLLKGFYDRKGNRWSLPVKDSEDVDPTGEGYDDSELRDLIAAKADKNHTHTGYAAVGHTHSEYAPTNHTHSEYISKTADIDSEPAEGSENLITSGAVYSACSGKAAASHTHNVSQITGLETALSELALQPSDNYLVICKKYVEDASVPAYPVSETYSQTLYYLNEFVEAHASEISGTVNKYIPCIVELKTASATAGKKVFAIVRLYNSNNSDDLYIEVYVGSSIFSIYGEAGAQGYTWTADGVASWKKTDYSTF